MSWNYAVSLIATALSLVSLVAVLILAREVGLLLVRLGPDRAMPTTDGIDIGEDVSNLLTHIDVAGNQLSPGSRKKPVTMLVFTRRQCVACQRLLPDVKGFARKYLAQCELRILSEDSPPFDPSLLKLIGSPGISIVSPVSFSSFNVHLTPYAIVTDFSGKVVARGVVNSIQQMESLLGVEFKVRGTTRRKHQIMLGSESQEDTTV